MSYLNLQQATRNNPIYAWTTKPAWKERFYQVTNELGIFYQTPSPEAFAQAVYQWQNKQSVTVLKVKFRHRFLQVEWFSRGDHAVDEVCKFSHHRTDDGFGRQAGATEPVCEHL